MIQKSYRSVLYMPGSNQRAIDKSRILAADAVIFDLEDAVAPDVKAMARELLLKEVNVGGFGARAIIVRINDLASPWGVDDAAAFANAEVDAILLPKVNDSNDLDALSALIPNTALWAMMETPRAILNAQEIASHPRLTGMVMGTNDLEKELNSRYRPDRLPLMSSLSLCVLAAKANSIVIVDGVFNAFKDLDGLREEALQGRDLGMDGKTLIHPAQLDVTNGVFAPSPSEIDLAERQITAFDEARQNGQGVAVVDGKIVENLHVETAKMILAKASVIAALEATS